MKKILTAISVAVIVSVTSIPEASAAAFTAGDTPQLFGKKKKKLEEENRRLCAEVDSLKRLVEEFYELLEQQENDTTSTEDNNLDTPFGSRLAPSEYTPEVTDSLLSLWYLQRSTSRNNEGGDYNMDSVHFTTNVPDKELIERLADMNSFITLPFNETVKNYILLYSEKMPTKMAQMLGLAQYYFPIFEETFNRYGLPEELKYMAVIESALNPVAVSRAGAKGMWQFMYTTAKSYGLTINSYVDERLDPVKSADAAARYLRDSYGVFGDWNLAISSYNCGAGNVSKAIRRSGSRNFWDIYDFLPRETRGYVPAFVGAMYAFRYYKEHGLDPATIAMPEHVDTFHVSNMLHFQQINEIVGVPVQTLRDLNPQYIHDIIPKSEKQPYILRLPFRYTASFIEHEDTVYKHRAKELFNPTTLENLTTASQERIVYRVKSGDYLGRIASRYHVSVNNIKKWNNLKNNNLRVGQKLVIYRKVKKQVVQQEPVTKQEKKPEIQNQADKPEVQNPADRQQREEKSGPDTAESPGISVDTAKDSTAVTSADTDSTTSASPLTRPEQAVSEQDGETAIGQATSAETLTGSSAAEDNTSVAATDIEASKEAPETAVEASGTAKEAGGVSSGKASGTTEYVTHTVKKGETLQKIVRRYPGVTVKEVVSLNNLPSADKIRYGMKLKIPKK